MKKIFFSLIAFVVCCTASAQNAQQKDAIQKCRTLYNATQEWVAEMKNEEVTNNSCTIVINRVVGGSGPQEKKVELFYNVDEDRDDGWGWNLVFARVSYNIAAMNYAEEYLYSKETGKLAFAFRKSDQYDGEYDYIKWEERLYINDAVVYYENKILDLEGKLLKTKKASELNEDNSWATATAESIKNLFGQVVNKVY